MKRLFLLIILVLIASYYAAAKIAEDAGYLLLSYKNITIETSLWVGLLLLLCLVVVAYVTIWLLMRLLRSRAMLRRWLHNFRHKRSVSKTSSGLIDMVEGDWKSAQKKLSKAAPQSDTPVINYLSAARAAAANNDSAGSELLLKKAHETTPEAGLAIGITKAEIQIQQQHFEQARTTLLVLRQNHPKHKHVAQLLQQVYVALEDWEALQELTPMLRKLRVASEAELDDLEKQAALKAIERAAELQPEQQQSECADHLQRVWLRIPAKIRQLEAVTRLYEQNMQRMGDVARAEVALREALNSRWSDELAVDYGLLPAENVQMLMKNAERWLKKHADSAELKLTMGRLCLRNQLWGKAREFFMASLALRETPQAHAELGRLLKHLGEQEAYQTHVQQGFEVISGELPVLPLPNPSSTNISQMAVKN